MKFKYLQDQDLNYNESPLSSGSPPEPSPAPPSSSGKKSSTNVGAIIGIILLSLFALAMLILGGFLLF